MLGQRFDADGLGRVVTCVQDVEAELLGIEKCPVLAFAGDERIEPRGGGLWNQRSPRAGDDSDPLHALVAERE